MTVATSGTGTPEIITVFIRIRVTRAWVFCVLFYGPLFVFCYFPLWLLNWLTEHHGKTFTV